VDYFLITNVLGCFLVTDLTRLLGLRKVLVAAAALMACGCLVKSGVPFAHGLPPYSWQVAGTVLVSGGDSLDQRRLDSHPSFRAQL
jgi:FLVCR family feline leukemia virus subgroup C receptor-related protein